MPQHNYGFLIQADPSNRYKNTYLQTGTLESSQIDRKVGFAASLGGCPYRMNVNKANWPTNKTKFLEEYQKAIIAGLSVVLNVQNGVDNLIEPSTGPIKFTEYPIVFATFVDNVLISLKNHNPQLPPPTIVVENEEVNQDYFDYDYNPLTAGIDDTDITTTCSKYIDELTKIVVLCSNYNWAKTGQPDLFIQIPVSNGGFTTPMSNQLTYDYILKQKMNLGGLDLPTAITQTNNDFGIKAMPPHFIRNLKAYYNGGTGPNAKSAKNALLIGQTYLLAYLSLKQTTNYLFNMNIHWYEPSTARGWDFKNGEDILQDDAANPPNTKYQAWDDTNHTPDWVSKDNVSGALPNVIQFYKDKGFGAFSPVTMNEVGQITGSQILTVNMLDALNTAGTIFNPIWFSPSTDKEMYKAKPFHDDMAATYDYFHLTPIGKKFYDNRFHFLTSNNPPCNIWQ